jgi:XTP/dITP diphosphohydrolase
MLDVVLATSNPHKIEELAAIFHAHGLERVRLLSLMDAAPGRTLQEPAETGATFEANAAIKALEYAHQTDMLCLADDSGLEVDALHGRPGVISSHYCTDGAETGMTRPQRDAANNARVLRELEGVPQDRRAARFVCVMALALHHRLLSTVRGTFEGRIGLPPRVPGGADGFGYDPLFLVAPDFARTAAELPPPEKNLLSHRAHAARQIAAILRQLAEQQPPTPA